MSKSGTSKDLTRNHLHKQTSREVKIKKQRDWGKEIKDVGILVMVIGAVMLLLAGYTMFSADQYGQSSDMQLFLEDKFPFLLIIGLISLLAGIIIKNIGHSKQNKVTDAKQEESK